MLGVTLRQSSGRSTYLRTSRASGFFLFFLFSFSSVGWSYPCPELLGKAGLVMQEWANRMPEAPAEKVLGYWLAANADMHLASDDTSEKSAERNTEPLNKFRSLAITAKENETDDAQARGAIYSFVQDMQALHGRIAWRPVSMVERRAQIVLQHPDSVKLSLKKILETITPVLSVSTTSTAAMVVGASMFYPVVGVIAAAYYGFKGYRKWYHPQADLTVLTQMSEVAEGRRWLEADQVLAIRVQSPKGADWVLMMVQAPDVNQPPPQPEAVGWGRLWRKAIGARTQATPAQLRPTLLGFLQGDKHETTPAAAVP